LADIYDVTSPFLKAYCDGPGVIHVATNGMDTIVMAPKTYDGYVLCYVRSHEGWVTDKLKGRPIADRSFMSVTREEIDSNENVGEGP